MPDFKFKHLPDHLDVHQKDVTALAYGGLRPVTVAVIYGEDDEERLARANELASCVNSKPKLMDALAVAESIIEAGTKGMMIPECAVKALGEIRTAIAEGKGETS